MILAETRVQITADHDNLPREGELVFYVDHVLESVRRELLTQARATLERVSK